MTYEEFESRAMAELQQTSDNGVVVLKEYTRSDCKSWRNLLDVGIYIHSTTYLHTMDEAMEYIRHRVEINDKECHDDIFCFQAMIHSYGMPISWDDDPIFAKATITFDGQGQYLDKSLCSGEGQTRTERNKFWGRPKEMIRFKEGDIVLVKNWEKLCWAIVTSLPPTIEQCWEFYERRLNWQLKNENLTISEDMMKTLLMMDTSDDTYTVITAHDSKFEGGHSHIASVDMFAPPVEVPAKVKLKFGEAYQRALASRKK